jgi:photosystem II stability/assembly factor-like uncharacterized protein
MTDDFERDPLARQLRESLARHAAQAPGGDLLAERIIHAADQRRAAARERQRRSWRSWALPLVAAAAVGGVVLAVVGIENYHPTTSPPQATNSGSPLLTTVPPTSARPTKSATTSETTPPPNAGDLTGVRLLDVTFVSEDTGWALASADCQSGAGRCTALLRTSDGTHWTSTDGVAFNVAGVSAGCATKCVSNIRFANDQVGYAYGPKAFFMTTDGGASWQQQPGGAIQLETLSGNVVRVTSSGTGCPGPCDVRVETSDLGSASWTDSGLGPLSGAAVTLSRGGSDAYLLVMRNPAGGANDATSTLYRSSDNGRSWVPAGEPCPQRGGEVDSHAVAAGGDDRVSVLCTDRFAAHRRTFVATSTDAGAHFAAAPGIVPVDGPSLLSGDAGTVLVIGGLDGLARSTDGAATWALVPEISGEVTFVGFESTTVGRAVTDNRIIWTTHDGGRTWTPATFG